jgi:hypothetical protein
MRRPLTTLVLVATCGSLAVLAAWALAGGVAAGTSSASTRADLAAATRTLHVSLSPAPGELSLAEISFHGSRRERISARSLQIAVSGPFGEDYLAVAVPRLGTASALRALVLLVDRASPLLDPVSVHLLITARRSLGAPVVRSLANPFTRTDADADAGAGAAPALCDLPLDGGALGASELSPLRSRGPALAGFGVASAVAQAYDVVCRLPDDSSFEQAVQQPASASPTPTAPEPVSTTPPAPPVGKIPDEGCKPEPGYACPLAARGALPAGAVGGARRASTGAH